MPREGASGGLFLQYDGSALFQFAAEEFRVERGERDPRPRGQGTGGSRCLSRLPAIYLHAKEIAGSSVYQQTIARLRCFKEIDNLTALALVCEAGDFTRFPNASSFMSFMGLVPSEYSSGGKRKQGGITKTGNTHLRNLLIESSWHYRYYSSPSTALRTRRQRNSEPVIGYADKALRRLQGKHIKLVRRGKNPKTATTAVAREPAGFIWGMMTGNYAWDTTILHGLSFCGQRSNERRTGYDKGKRSGFL